MQRPRDPETALLLGLVQDRMREQETLKRCLEHHWCNFVHCQSENDLDSSLCVFNVLQEKLTVIQTHCIVPQASFACGERRGSGVGKAAVSCSLTVQVTLKAGALFLKLCQSIDADIVERGKGTLCSTRAHVTSPHRIWGSIG